MLNDAKHDPIFLSEQEFRKRFDYDPDKILGEGGFACVYKAYDRQFDEVVALKFYTHLEANKYDVMREMRNSRKFTHKNIIRVHDAHIIRKTNSYGRTEEVQVGVLEFANGGNLRNFLQTVPTEAQFREVLIGILEGLEYLHKEKLTIHRDLSPDNVLMFIEGGRWIPKIADFGISKRLDVGTINLNDQKLSSQLVGKIEYMAPEQFDPNKYGINGKIGTNVDLWALGIILVEIFAQSTPFGDRTKTESPMEVMHNILHSSLPKYVDDIPEPYRSVIKYCLEKNAQKRAQTAGELIQIIQQYKEKKKPKAPALLRVSLLLALLLGFSLLIFWFVSKPNSTEQVNENKKVKAAPVREVKTDHQFSAQHAEELEEGKPVPTDEQPLNDDIKNAEEQITELSEAPVEQEAEKVLSSWNMKLYSFQRDLNRLDNSEINNLLRKQRIKYILKEYFVNEQVPVKMNGSEKSNQPIEISNFLLETAMTADSKPDREWEIIEAKPNADDKIVSLTVREKSKRK